MEFKVGDKVRAKGNIDGVDLTGKIGKVISVKKESSQPYAVEFDEEFSKGHSCESRGKNGYCRWATIDELELINSKSLHKTMEKKVYNVLIVSKKTGKVNKHQIVSAENEQSAILKAFGVDVENVFIKITEEGSYTEDKPVTAILVKESKTLKAE